MKKEEQDDGWTLGKERISKATGMDTSFSLKSVSSVRRRDIWLIPWRVKYVAEEIL